MTEQTLLVAEADDDIVRLKVNGEYVDGKYYSVLGGRGERIWAPVDSFLHGSAFKVINRKKLNENDEGMVEALAEVWRKEMAKDNGVSLTEEYIKRNTATSKKMARRMMRIIKEM